MKRVHFVLLAFLSLVITLLHAGSARAATSATVFYQTGWSTTNIHYGIGGTWTAVPGVPMQTACAGWVKRVVDLGTATTFQVTFNNGSGTWDNNSGANYTLGTGNVTVANRVIGSGDPCATGPGNTAEVFYQTGWTTANIHYGIGGTWTTVPGVPMQAACTGWLQRTIDLGTATTFQVTLNNGSGTWDNNNGANYTVGTGRTTIRNGILTPAAPNPCASPSP
ncbi:carbohydrate binding domain-containing protein, partial [Acrocarpospora macrocephala]